MFDLLRFFSLNSLFDLQPDPTFPSYGIFLSVFGVLLIISIVIFFFLRFKKTTPPLKKLLKPIPLALQIFAIVGLFLVLFRLSGAYYLSMRVFFLIWFVLFIWYLVRLSQKIKQYPVQLQEFISREENKKYAHASRKKKR